MKTGYLDCFSGISGDMLLGAFIDAGWEEQELKELPSLLKLKDVKIAVKRVKRQGISAVKVEITEKSSNPPKRGFSDIARLISSSGLEPQVKDEATAAFKRLAEVEARIHGVSVDEVHFHETGAEDAIIDITGAFAAKRALGLERLICSPLPLSRGFVQCQHGRLPLPAPAVLEILAEREVYFVDEEKELVTPTGALLAVELSDSWAEFPAFKVKRTGYGAGSWKLKGRPNLLRIVLGQETGPNILSDEVLELKAVIDDMNPEHAGLFMKEVLLKGALDAWITPVFMKKNRPGFEISIILRPEKYHELIDSVLSHTTSLGLRTRRSRRVILPRHEVTVSTRWGDIKAKAVIRPDGKKEIIPEFEECRAISEGFDVPIRDVYKEVICSKKARGGDGEQDD